MMVTDAMRAAAKLAMLRINEGSTGLKFSDLIDAMAGAALEDAESAAWEPIETAPRDRFILLWCPEDRSRWLAKYQGGRWYGVDDEGLTREGAGPEDVTGWAVTHWCPLPERPVTLSAAPNATTCRVSD